MAEHDVVHPATLKSLLARHGFTLKKGFGQNFLIDERVLARIVDATGVTAEDGAFEIGPGAGVLTRRLAMRARRVVAIEKDPALRPLLDEVLAGFDNVQIVFADALDVDLSALWCAFDGCRRVVLAANLPYYVTTPLLFHVLESGVPLSAMVLMVQREVADRMMAAPGSKVYGALSVAVQYRADVERVCNVHPGAFLPPPDVESSVVKLSILPSPAVAVRDESLFFRVVRAAFGTRRKTLLNALAGGLGADKATVRGWLASAGVAPDRRGETLSLAEFAAIADAMAASPV
ncbi:MAG: 16S rRNA (adenine(1518)-N(6)/adenine(1519)-N(6))-dimethyltransferase RsmA [Thermoflavifilum sp.]|nr:16S rRNA (adenine(1518)-N(6)/adenine(1519)-N(6))-dimethyltransferase RsmA [Thermoflavifilum sp.]MCL6513767.1 16S rRNA (adenine(1518)-N(6)/adenine(1519)-N(6))-dimethyltransferase RsmA [Alicyclobacillus sp.]